MSIELQQAHARHNRQLSEVLARLIDECKPGDVQIQMLDRIYAAMTPVEKLAVQAELHEIRCARRGITRARTYRSEKS